MCSKRSNNRLNLSSQAKVRSTRILNAWMASLKMRLRPRLGRLRLWEFFVILGIMPALKMHLRLCVESKPPSRLREAPLRSNPTCLASFFKACSPCSNRTRSQHIAIVVYYGDDLLPFLVFVAGVANAIPPFLATVLVPSPWRILRSSFFAAERWATLATNACQSDPSSAHLAKTL